MSMDLLDELKMLIRRLDEEKIEYALCDGLAMAVYALPRATLDIDLMILPSSLEDSKRVVQSLGFTVRAIPMELHGGKVHIHRVSKIDPATEEALPLNLLTVTPPLKGCGGVVRRWSGKEASSALSLRKA
jgi:hypothetical protein